MKGHRGNPGKDRRARAMAQHPSAGREWAKGYDDRMGARCMATTVRDPEAGDWSPEQPDTVVTATCNLSQTHKGWHVDPDGYAWDPDDDAQHVQFPRPA